MKTIILSLITITACLLLTGCSGGGGGGSSGGSSSPEPLSNTTADGGGDGSGGGGDGNNGGGGGNGNGSNGDGVDERPSFPAEVELSISPFIDGLRIQWHNLSAIEGAGGIYIHLNLTGGNPPQPDERKIAIEDFSDDSYEIDGLDNGTAYRLVGVRVEQANNTFWVIDNITWSEPWEAKTNALDNNGGGIVVGANHDGDGRADGVDEDDDNDGRPNSMDACRLGEIGWSSADSMLDYDSDGCRDEGMANNGHGEDTDDDNDMVLDEDEVDPSCVLDKDCDNDGSVDSADSCPAGRMGWMWEMGGNTNDMDGDGCHNDEDIDDDGDSLIEIGTAAELDAVRWVLDGTGFRANETAMLNQTGCGDRAGMTVCNGYELVRDISLTDYIADNYPVVGWRPIAHSVGIHSSSGACVGDEFTGIFDGNEFEVSGLFINRSNEDCIGLFGQVEGTIRNLGVIVDRVIGKISVGSLVGESSSASIIQSYAVSGEVRGNRAVGGLIGSIVLGNIEIIQSYAISGIVRGDFLVTNTNVGGLIGSTIGNTEIIQSYAVSSEVRGGSLIAGLLGFSGRTDTVQSYAVSGEVSGHSGIAGLIGLESSASNTRASYWDIDTSGITNDGTANSEGWTSDALRMPIGYTGIYATWDDGAGVDGINDNTTIWCDEDASGMIEDDERRGAGDPNGDNRVWDFGTSTDYPALRCTGDSLTDQRAWWHLNATGQPELNQTRLDAYLDGTLPEE